MLLQREDVDVNIYTKYGSILNVFMNLYIKINYNRKYNKKRNSMSYFSESEDEDLDE